LEAERKAGVFIPAGFNPTSRVSALLVFLFEPFRTMCLRSKGALRRSMKKERQTMPLYEHVFMTRQDVSSSQIESLTDAFKSIIEEGGGKVTKSEYWGLKTLTYRIKKNRKAHYNLMNIDSPHEAIAEMERQQAINDDVIRILTLRVDEHEEGPSAMMQRPGRDDKRGYRRDGPRKPGFRDDKGGDKATPASAPDKQAVTKEATS
jgi:small subunit ribosomal protein S6